LNSVAHSEITLLELFLHTKQLTIQIESLASICNLQKWSHCVSDTDFEDLITKATSEFCNFYTGANLLTFLYAQLQVNHLISMSTCLVHYITYFYLFIYLFICITYYYCFYFVIFIQILKCRV
jgi:hypothetical protein